MRLLICLLLLAWLPHAAAQNRVIEYRDVQRALERVGELDGYRYVRSRLTLGGPAVRDMRGPIRMTLKTLQRDIELEVDAERSVNIPYSAALLSEQPQIWTNLPNDSSRLTFEASLRVEAPAQREFDYQLVGEMREELRRVLAQRGFLARMLSPTVRGLRVVFDPGQRIGAEVQTREGTLRFQSDARGILALPVSDIWIRDRVQVRLAAMPRSVQLELDN